MGEDDYRGKAGQTINFTKTKREVGSKGTGGDPLKIREPNQFLKVGIKELLQVNENREGLQSVDFSAQNYIEDVLQERK